MLKVSPYNATSAVNYGVNHTNPQVAFRGKFNPKDILNSEKAKNIKNSLLEILKDLKNKGNEKLVEARNSDNDAARKAAEVVDKFGVEIPKKIELAKRSTAELKETIMREIATNETLQNISNKLSKEELTKLYDKLAEELPKKAQATKETSAEFLKTLKQEAEEIFKNMKK